MPDDENARAPEPRLRVLPWWMVAVGLLFAVVMGAVVTWWLFREAGAGTDVARLRMDAIRTGLTVVAGSGGAVALLLAARRQWLSERAQRHLEAAKARDEEHARQVQEHVAATAKTSEEDALQRRLAELFTNGVEQLGSDNASIRLGGLYTLERLAQQDPPFRQIVADVLCGYLRMELDGDTSDEARSSHAITVRQAIQAVLMGHLRNDSNGDYWPGLRLNLAGAHLYGFDARRAVLANADFTGATFHSGANFVESQFLSTARFRSIRLANGTMSFNGARFDGRVLFDTVRIEGELDFGEFDGRQIAIVGHFQMRDATIAGNLTMNAVDFNRSAHFDRSEFSGTTRLTFNTFTRNTSFHHCKFDVVRFRRSRFEGIASFNATEFAGDTSFESAYFGDELNFTGARFHNSVRFDGVKLARRPYFQGTHAFGDHIREWPPGCREVETADGEVTVERTDL